MNIVVEQSSSMQAWKLLDRIRAVSPMDSHEFTQGLAALLFLRWASVFIRRVCLAMMGRLVDILLFPLVRRLGLSGQNI